MNIKLLLLIFTLFTSLFSWANDPIYSVLNKNFEAQDIKRYFNLTLTSFYQRGACTNNIYHLLQKLDSNGENIKDAKVIYVLDYGPNDFKNIFYADPRESQKRYFSPNPYLTRYSSISKPVTWTLHVFLESNGKIYDFDYTKSPQVISKQEYFKKMFYYKKEMESKMDYSMRVIPAKDYLNLYSLATGSETYEVLGSYLDFIDGEVRGQQFPLLFMKDYLQESTEDMI